MYEEEVDHSVRENCPEDALPKDIDLVLNELRYARVHKMGICKFTGQLSNRMRKSKTCTNLFVYEFLF